MTGQRQHVHAQARGLHHGHNLRDPPALAARVDNWRVLDEVETLSDHLYIRMRVCSPLQRRGNAARGARFPRWVTSQFDSAMAEAAAVVETWGNPPLDNAGAETMAPRMREALTTVCDASMPRQRKMPAKRHVYWWSEEIAALRRTSNAARRAYTHCRRRRQHTAEKEGPLHRTLKEAKEALKTAIIKAKDTANE